MLTLINLSIAFGLANIQEEYVLTSRKSWRQGGSNMEKGSFEPSAEVTRGQKSSVPIKKVFSSQMDEKRKKGLCYHCDAKWNLSHVCKNPKVYFLQLEDSMESEL